MSKQSYFFPVLSDSFDRLAPLALPALRVTIGIILMAHGYGKFNAAFFGDGIGGLSGFIASKGLPAPELLAWLTIVTEFGGGICIFFGLFTRLFAAMATIMMLVVVLVFKDVGVFKGGYEYELLIAVCCLVFAVRGAEGCSIDAKLKTTF